jgi:hypothetical protein
LKVPVQQLPPPTETPNLYIPSLYPEPAVIDVAQVIPDVIDIVGVVKKTLYQY